MIVIDLRKKDMKIKELCMDERPREKMMSKGTDSLSNAELLAILLRTGTTNRNVIDVARDLISKGEGKLNTVASMPLDKLCETEGVGPSKAVTVAAAFELGRRCASEGIVTSRTSISSPKTVFRIMLPILRGLDHEECWILYVGGFLCL